MENEWVASLIVSIFFVFVISMMIYTRKTKAKRIEKKVAKFSEDLIKSRSKWNTRN